MERRNRSLKALEELIYIDTLDDQQRADSLVSWGAKYLADDGIMDFDLNESELSHLLELFYKNLEFLKQYKSSIGVSMDENQKIKKFILNKH
ncbi:hypothetical protein [Arcobacter sp. FWKO B]|uniref:hypothetical protein n=1 Tax=Arcobacter sp. FWKO B TaxID=2593672 RepID=UPI0018A57EF1|nr:hypothetical protein [Arcobacter sp. FWKO B]QOG12392.1 hypothetical protein FWKOB_06630 [Arcobacter sp. FWKO B]